MITIAIANQKGGVGKTTTAVSLAHGLSVKGKEVLLVDADPQGHCALFLGLTQEPGLFNLLVGEMPLRDVVRTTRRSRLWLLPGNKRSGTAASVLGAEGAGIDTLRNALIGRIDGTRLDYVVIDTSPSVGGLQEMALYAADYVVIPVAVDIASIAGALQLTETLKRLKAQSGWQGGIFRVVPTFHDEQTRESRENLADLRRRFGEMVSDYVIHRATLLRECVAMGQTVFEMDPKSRAAEEYAMLVWEVLDGAR